MVSIVACCGALLLSSITSLAIAQNATVQNTTAPSSPPTAAPTYGPASESVVKLIMLNTLGGIVIILVFYFFSGHYLYKSDIHARLHKSLSPSSQAQTSQAQTSQAQSGPRTIPPERGVTERSPLLDVEDML